MYVLLVRCAALGRCARLHLVDETGHLAHSARTVQAALSWLVARGEEQVVAMTDDGPELFLIEPCEGLQMTLPALSLRRAHHGSCCDLPPIPGLSPDPTLRAGNLDDRGATVTERRARRTSWLRRATA